MGAVAPVNASIRCQQANYGMTGQSNLVSIIIPCKEIGQYALESVNSCRKLEYKNCEIILLPDSEKREVHGIRVIPTGSISPGAKRNIGTKNAKGEIVAYTDSDAYPDNNWLDRAMENLKADVVAVGGPGLTPSEDNMMQRASGLIMSSIMVGDLSKRYRKYSAAQYTDELSSCNFVMRKGAVEAIGGWNEKYWPGEDTLLCTEMRKMNMKMIEAPDVLVYHHRRPLWIPHLSQVFGYGIHRGLFARKFGGTSLKPKYFMPSFLLVGFLSFLLCSIWSAVAFYSSLTLLSMYLLGDLLAALMQTQDPRMVPLLLAGIPLTHLTYGIAFVIGLLKDDLNR